MDSLEQHPEPAEDRAGEARASAPVWAEPGDLFFFRLGTLLGDDGERQVEILALAESGAIVRTGERLDSGRPFILELNSHHRFEARVEWLSDDLVGLEFEDRGRVRETLAARNRAHPYRAPRLNLSAEVVLRLGETCITTRARDVSEGGIKVELDEPGHVGREALVIVPGMAPVGGLVSWCRDGRAGIRFEQPVAFASLADCFTRRKEAGD